MSTKNGPAVLSGTGITYGPDGITSRWVLVTPEMAAKWLTNNHNRTLRKSTVDKYANQLAKNQWQTHHQGIAFDSSGVLRDGQHRLSAIVQCGISVWMLITEGVHSDSIMGMDQLAIRNKADVLRLMGVDATNSAVAIIKFMISGPTHVNNSRAISTEDIKECFAAWGDAVSVTHPLWKIRNIRCAPILACIARAWMHGNQDRIERFVEILETGEIASAEERGALRIRNYHLERGAGGGNSERVGYYRKTQSAIRAFLDRRDLTKIYECIDDIFPLPADRIPSVLK